MKIWDLLKERRVAQFFVMYCVVGWFVLQAFDQVADREVVPELVYRVVLTLFLCGLPGALIVSWFHGAKGHQKVPALETWLLGFVFVFAIAASGFVIRAELAPGQADGAAATRLPWEDPTRVAVLYFDARGGGEDAAFLAAGLTEGLIDELSAVDALHVVSRNGSALFRGSPARPDSIGRSLGVGTLVNGTVQVTGDRVRLETALVESRTGKQLDSRRIEHPRADLFDLQDELTRQVALFLRERIGVEVGQIEARSGTRVVQAWELLQRAEQTADRARDRLAAADIQSAREELLAADSLLARAEALDPDWHHPTTRRGWLAYERSRLQGLERGRQTELHRAALSHADRALRHEPRNPDALEMRATVRYWRYLLNLATDDEKQDLLGDVEADLRTAVAGRPRQASAWATLSHLLLNRGDVPQAKLAALRAYEADPFLRNVNLTLHRLASASWDLADPVEAQRWCDEGLRRFPDDYRFRQCQLRLFALNGHEPDVPAAWARYREYVERAPPQVHDFTERMGLMYVAQALVRAGLPDSARAVAVRGRAGADVDPLRELAWMEAVTRTWLGDYDEAVRLLGLYLSANPGLVDGYRAAALNGQVHWYLQDILDHRGFRDLVGLR